MSQALPYSLEQLRDAFGYVESTNDYGELGPITESGNRAYGRYQVMDFNIPSWTEQHLGQRLTPEQYLASPEAQDAVFMGQMGDYYARSSGSPAERVRNAGSLWFTGRPFSAETAGFTDRITGPNGEILYQGISNQEYGDRILRALGSAPQGASEMTMDPNPPQQPRGFLGGIFGGQQRQPDPNAGSPTDPFANLSRAQRTMLGFAALRDAAASLEGRDSNYFSSALGGFEAARERERLRAQGIFQNQVAAAQALAQVQADIARNRAFGIEPTEAQLTLERMLSGAALEGFGGVAPSVTTGATPRVVPAGGAPGATPSVVRPADQDLADRAVRLDPETGGVDIAGDPFPAETPQPVVTPSELPIEAAPTPVIEPDVAAPNDFAAQIGELDDEFSRLNNLVRQRLAAGAGITDLQFLIDDNRARRAELTEAQAAAEQAAAQQRADTATSAERAERLVLPEINEALDFLVRGFDEQGQPVFNPVLETAPGRAIAGALQGPEYQNYVGVIETLRTGVLLDALEQATVGSLSDGEREALSAAQGQLDPANPQGTYRAIMRMQEVAQESIARRNREAGASNGAATPQINWD